jgi:hypothetical protein
VQELQSRSLAEYMALPASQYSVLDARKVRPGRGPCNEGGTAMECERTCEGDGGVVLSAVSAPARCTRCGGVVVGSGAMRCGAAWVCNS